MRDGSPRLRTVAKTKPPYPLGHFPKDFPLRVGEEIAYILATSPNPSIEGSVWERIFARAIGADWKPSNVGLDDVILNNCAWGAKTVKNPHPHRASTVRLISGRNSPAYSFGDFDLRANPQQIGAHVLDIWNARVESIREKFRHVRTVVLVKSADLAEFTVFETETHRYPPDRYKWVRNQRGNLEGWEVDKNLHCFTWQSHGSQFTIIESIPDSRLSFRLRKPRPIPREITLEAIGFDRTWIEIIQQ